MDPHALRTRIRALLEPAVDRLGFELVAVQWMGGGRGGVLRLTIDHPQGVSADDCAEVSRLVSPFLDEDDPISGAYSLEVSSPGIDRPVQRAEDFVRYAGCRAKVRLEPGPPRRNYTGVLRGVEDDAVLLEVEDQVHRLRLDAIESARLVLDLDEFMQLSRTGNGDQP